MELENGFSRRGFLGALATATGGVALVGTAELAYAAKTRPPGVRTSLPNSTLSWDTIKQLYFTLPNGQLHFNNAGQGQMSLYTLDRLADAYRDVASHPQDAFGRLNDELDKTRAKAARLLGCSLDEAVITSSTTHGMNLLAQGLRLRSGDRVLTTDQEHPGGTLAWEYFAKRDGVKLERVALPLVPKDPSEIVSAIKAALNEKTRVVSLSYVTFTTGLRLPISEIAKVVHAHGALLVVDAAQAAGALKINVKSLGCDALATSGQKSVLGPQGTGMLFIRKESHSQFDSLSLQEGFAVRTEATGMRDIASVIALGHALDFLDAFGADRIQERALHLRAKVIEGLSELGGVEFLSTRAGPLASQLVSFALPPGKSNEQVWEALQKKHQICVKLLPEPVKNGLRLTMHISLTERDVRKLLGALREELG